MITLSIAGLLRSLVYGFTTTDPRTVSAASLVLLLIALLALDELVLGRSLDGINDNDFNRYPCGIQPQTKLF